MGEDPDRIRREIEATRNEMGETVDALTYKADVKSRAKESLMGTKDSIKSKVVRCRRRQRRAGQGRRAPRGGRRAGEPARPRHRVRRRRLHRRPADPRLAGGGPQARPGRRRRQGQGQGDRPGGARTRPAGRPGSGPERTRHGPGEGPRARRGARLQRPAEHAAGDVERRLTRGTAAGDLPAAAARRVTRAPRPPRSGRRPPRSSPRPRRRCLRDPRHRATDRRPRNLEPEAARVERHPPRDHDAGHVCCAGGVDHRRPQPRRSP